MEVVSTERRIATRRALVDAARELVFEQGHKGISVQDITSRADLATGTYYNYFDTKTEIFLAVAEEMKRDIAAELEQTRENIKDPAMRLAVTLKYYFLQAMDNTDWIEFTRCAGLRHLALQQDSEQLLEDLERGVSGGRFRVDDVYFTQMLISGMIDHVNRAIDQGRASRQSVDHAVRAILQMLGLPEMVSKALIQTARPPLSAPRRRDRDQPTVTSISEYTAARDREISQEAGS